MQTCIKCKKELPKTTAKQCLECMIGIEQKISDIQWFSNIVHSYPDNHPNKPYWLKKLKQSYEPNHQQEALKAIKYLREHYEN